MYILTTDGATFLTKGAKESFICEGLWGNTRSCAAAQNEVAKARKTVKQKSMLLISKKLYLRYQNFKGGKLKYGRKKNNQGGTHSPSRGGAERLVSMSFDR